MSINKTIARCLVGFAITTFTLIMAASPAIAQSAGQIPWHGPSVHRPVLLPGLPHNRGPKMTAHRLGSFPLSFELNEGQVNSKVKFLSRGNGYALFLAPTEAVFSLREPSEHSKIQKLTPSTGGARYPHSKPEMSSPSHFVAPPASILRMQLEGAHAKSMRGEGMLPGKTNYLMGRDPRGWRTDIPTYRKVRCSEIYPGVDLVYYGNQRQLEYDLIVAPRADPARVALKFEGADRLTVERSGDLVVRLKRGSVRWHSPLAYQELNGKRRTIGSRFVLKGRNRVGFAVARYDTHRPLVIDPVFAYASYLGGTSGDDPLGIAVDNDGNAYVTGITDSKDFPGAGMPPPGEASFVTKIDVTGTKLLYSTYIGQNVIAHGIAVSGTFEAYVVGRVLDDRLPVVRGAQSATGGGQDGFLMKINAAGNGLDYSSYLGGSGFDIFYAVALGPDGSAYVTGASDSDDFPAVAPYQATRHGLQDAVVARIDTTKSGPASLLYSTYLGGNDMDIAFAITVDPRGQIYVSGRTTSPDFPVVSAYEPVLKGAESAIVSAFSADGSRLIYSTYLGGKAGTSFGEFTVESRGIAVDGSQHVYISGTGFAGNFNGEPFFSGFVAEIDCAAAGSASLVYMKNADFRPAGIGIDIWGNACTSGYSGSRIGAAKFHHGDGSLMFQASFGPGGATATAVDRSGHAYIAGITTGPGLPVTADAFQTRIAGAQSPVDCFVARMPTFTKLDLNGDTMPDLLFQNREDGRLLYWLMQGDQQSDVQFLDAPNPEANWRVVGSADLNGDGQTDLILQDSSSGDLSYWLMNGTHLLSAASFPPQNPGANWQVAGPQNPGANWQVAGVADMDRDGYADIVFQNSVSGDIYMWFLQGTSLIGGNYLIPKNPGAGWKVMAVGDLNNDGQPDIVFQNVTTGRIYIWYLRYGTLLSGGFVNPAYPGAGWIVAGLADINGDGRLEILLQNAGTGQVAYWAMKGLNVARIGFPNPSNPGALWKLAGVK